MISAWKSVWRVWRNSPRAKGFLGVYVTLTVISQILGAHFVTPQISRALLDPSVANISYLAALIVLGMGIDIWRPWGSKHAAVSQFGDVLNIFTRKVLFTTFPNLEDTTPAILNSCVEANNEMSKFAKTFGDLMFGLAGLGAGLTAVYRFAGNTAFSILGVYAVAFVIMLMLQKSQQRISRETHRLKKERDKLLHNAIRGAAEVRSYGQGERIYKELTEMTDGICESIYRKNRYTQAFFATFTGVDGIGSFLAVILCAFAVKNGEMSLESAFTTVNLVGKLWEPLNSVVNFFDWISDAAGKADDLLDVLEWEIEEDGETEKDDFNECIELKNVHFGYRRRSNNVLKGVNVRVPKGARVAFVGDKGAGKSTVTKLLLGFYKQKSGSIEIDGMDIRGLSRKSMSRLFGVVFQDNTIMDGTIMENIMFGNPDGTLLDVIDSAKAAGIYDFIKSLPEGFNYKVGPNGNKLSGGQRQGISIARMLMRSPKVVILDEATSALDNKSERMVQEAIDRLSADTTVIAIAHRLTTIQNFDVINVMKNGKIVESGTHDELLARNGEYARLWNA